MASLFLKQIIPTNAGMAILKVNLQALALMFIILKQKCCVEM
jgi:hypothetical protein